MAKIAEAYSDETGGSRGGVAGDQGTPGNTGKPSQGGEEVRDKLPKEAKYALDKHAKKKEGKKQ